jgi:hypothetical protein
MSLVKAGLEGSAKFEPTLTLDDVVISFNGVAQEINPEGKYYVPSGAEVSVSASILGGGLISLPVLKLVAEECADNKPIGREVYINGAIDAGTILASVTFGVSTNYKVTAERNNRAIDRMFHPEKAPFHLAFKTLDFLS